MKGLHGWMRLLENNEAAVLSVLLSELDRVTGSDDSSGEQLANIILKDAHLTANIIRVANSVTFNPNNVSVTTVSRAVINIGFKHIRSLCLSIKVLEAVLKEKSSSLLLSTLASSLHAASQAKSLCSKMKASQQEEVFVACLLSHLAELLVLGVQESEVKLLTETLEASSTTQEKDRAAEKYLGVSMTRLSKTLVKQWRMQGLIMDVVTNSNTEDIPHALKAIHLGNEISRTALLGWDSSEFKEVMFQVAEFQAITPEDAKKHAIKMADLTSETVMSFGKKVLVDFIPTSKKSALPIREKADTDSAQLLPNNEFKVKAIEQIKQMMNGKFNINTIFKAVLKGLNQGVGLERITLAIFDKNHSKFIAKNVMGEGTEHWKESFVVRFERTQSGFLYQLFQRDQKVWVGGEQFKEISNYVGSEFLGITGQKQFFIAPMQVNNKIIGFIYSDMGSSSSPLSIQYFEGFHQFIQLVNKALMLLAEKK